MVPRSHPPESIDQARRRLAERAAECGVTLRDDGDGRWYASSVSQPGTWHVVTAWSCDCPGFVRHQRCIHHSALLAHLGWLPDDDPPDPDPVGAVLSLMHAPHVDCPALATRPHVATTICVDAIQWLRIEGEGPALRVWWVEPGRKTEHITTGTPAKGDHRLAVAYWVVLLALTTRGHIDVTQEWLDDAVPRAAA